MKGKRMSEKKQKTKPKPKKDDFSLTVKGNSSRDRKIRISLDFKSEGLTTEELNAYLLATHEAVEKFREDMCSKSNGEWLKKSFPHYVKEIERKISSYVT
jgi:hypothetical protein